VTGIIALAYCSRPVDFSFDQVDAILATSRRNNAAAGLTGALIYDNRTFLQWLEGEADDLRGIFGRIARDPRHADVRLLSVRKLTDRWFPDWSMTAAVTEDQTLRGLKLVPHLTVKGFDPHDWSEGDTAVFMAALSDYLNRRPAPESTAGAAPVAPRPVGRDPLADLDHHLDGMR
jgi:hypothetical protein